MDHMMPGDLQEMKLIDFMLSSKYHKDSFRQIAALFLRYRDDISISERVE